MPDPTVLYLVTAVVVLGLVAWVVVVVSRPATPEPHATGRTKSSAPPAVDAKQGEIPARSKDGTS
jgi:hypothetical protein